MKISNKPEMTPLTMGNIFKVLQVEGSKGMKMPPHHSTQEAVIVVQKGEALLQMPDGEHLLEAGDSFIIPAKKEHSLSILKDLKALAIMAVESEIIFI